jgi:hypothetical protein
MSEEEPIKIVIVDEEPPLKADPHAANTQSAVADTGKKAAVIAKVALEKAWNSETGRKAAKKLQEASDRGIRYVGTRMADAAEEQAKQTAAAVQQRVRETDWQEEAKVGLVSGLKWLSAQAAELAGRVTADKPEEKSPADNDQPGRKSGSEP